MAFAQCFKELVENCPETESYLMLGDAYMSIQGNGDIKQINSKTGNLDFSHNKIVITVSTQAYHS